MTTDSRRSPPAPVVLLVDDHDDLREATALFLRRSGFTVEEACNGMEALRSLAARLPDIVLTDLRMPLMDGSSLCRQIRATERLAGILIVALTAYSSFDAEARAEAGFDRVIAKGSLHSLLREVRHALAERRHSSSLPKT